MRFFFFTSTLVLGACAAGNAHHAQHTAHHRFENAEAWAARFEAPERDAWQRPDELIAALALAPDARVADIGAATGYFPVRLARAVPQGHVYGVDVEQTMVDFLHRRASREGLTNLTAHLADADDPRLPEACDVILLVDTYHHVEARPAYFEKLRASLKPGGRLVIVDFKPGSSMGPPHKLSAQEVEAELTRAGYVLTRTHALLPEQYFLEFQAR